VARDRDADRLVFLFLSPRNATCSRNGNTALLLLNCTAAVVAAVAQRSPASRVNLVFVNARCQILMPRTENVHQLGLVYIWHGRRAINSSTIFRTIFRGS